MTTPLFTPLFASGLSKNVTPDSAANHVVDQIALDGSPDLLLGFVSPPHAGNLAAIADILNRRLTPQCTILVVGDSPVGESVVVEQGHALSVLAASLPDGWVNVVSGEDQSSAPDVAKDLLGPDRRISLLFGHQQSDAPTEVIDHMEKLAGSTHVPIVGTLSEHASLAIVDGDIVEGPDAVVGISIGGPFAADAWVSQGCIPFGPVLIVTRVEGRGILELGGLPVLHVIQREVAALSEDRRRLLAAGLYLGRAVSEHRDYYGRDDFVLSPMLRIIQEDGAVLFADAMRVGQSVRLHLKDPAAATQDLRMVLDMQRLRGQASAALMFAPPRFDELTPGPGLDAAIVSRMLSAPEAGEQLAKSGRRLDPGARPTLPLAGTISTRQVGPLGRAGNRRTFNHAQCTVLTVLRPLQPGE